MFSITRFFLLLFTCFCGLYPLAAEPSCTTSHRVLVSAAPHKYFVERIAGDTLRVQLLVPAAVSMHTFEPSAKQVLESSRSDLWFQMGETFEKRAGAALRNNNPCMAFVDLRQNVNLIKDLDPSHGVRCSCHGAGSEDLHYWLSPREAKHQAETIARALIQRYPEQRALYERNLQQFLQELDDLDREIVSLLQGMKSRTLLVSHPAYAYLARDYGLKQVSIEFEGKDPTPRQLTMVLNLAKQENIHVIYTQRQYSNKGAQLVAHTLNAKIVSLDPYAEDYIGNLRTIAHIFAEQ